MIDFLKNHTTEVTKRLIKDMQPAFFLLFIFFFVTDTIFKGVLTYYIASLYVYILFVAYVILLVIFGDKKYETSTQPSQVFFLFVTICIFLLSAFRVATSQASEQLLRFGSLVFLFVGIFGFIYVVFIKTKKRYKYKALNIGVVFFSLLILVRVVVQGLAIDGTYTVTIMPNSIGNNFIGDIPTYQLDGQKFYFVEKPEIPIIVKLPLKFDSVMLSMDFKPTSNERQIVMGAKNINGGRSTTVLMDYDFFIEGLPRYWQSIREGDTILYVKNKELQRAEVTAQKQKENAIHKLEAELNKQKEEVTQSIEDKVELKKRLAQIQSDFETSQALVEEQYTVSQEDFPLPYASIEEFLSSEPSFSKTLVYKYPVENIFRLDNADKNHETTLPFTFVGPLDLLVYVTTKTPLSFKGSITGVKEGDVIIKLSQNDKELKKQTISLTEDMETFSINIGDTELDPGIYHLSFTIPPGMGIKGLNIPHTYALFESDLTITEAVGDTQLFTSGEKIKVQPTTISALNKSVEINDKTLIPTQVGSWKEITLKSGRNQIRISQGGLVLRTIAGMMWVGEDNPLWSQWNYSDLSLSSFDQENFDYILAEYKRPEILSDGTYRISEMMEYPDADLTKDTAQLFLNFKSARADGLTYKVRSIMLTFRRDPITLRSIINHILKKK